METTVLSRDDVTALDAGFQDRVVGDRVVGNLMDIGSGPAGQQNRWRFAACCPGLIVGGVRTPPSQGRPQV